jgi:hypothetical protein
MGKSRERNLSKKFHEYSGHWLREGLSGQNSLLAEVDPFLFLADPIFSKNASQISYHYDGDELRPQSFVLLPKDSLPWHLGFLSEKFALTAIVESHDELLDVVAEQFNFSIADYDFAANRDGRPGIDFITRPAVYWESVEELYECLKLIQNAVASGGRSCLFFEGQRIANEDYLLIGGSEQILIKELLALPLCAEFAKIETEIIPIERFREESQFRVSEFNQKHKNYFGRGARELIMARIYEQDWQKLLMESQAGTIHTSVTLTLHA